MSKRTSSLFTPTIAAPSTASALSPVLLLASVFCSSPCCCCLGFVLGPQPVPVCSLWYYQGRRQQHRRQLPDPPTTTTSRNSKNDCNEEPDLFDYFDPLLSPHSYPNGISPDRRPAELRQGGRPVDEQPATTKTIATTATTNFGDSVAPDVAAETTHDDDRRPLDVDIDPTEVFDPTLSPHLYTGGVPGTILGDEGTLDGDYEQTRRQTKMGVVGVLLVDHGSRNAASNERLHALAEMYQEEANKECSDDDDESSSTRVIVVRAAHMEIASPSIFEGLRSLLSSMDEARNGDTDGGVVVDEIVCHPYFLSPAGRHATEDIPRLVRQAVETLLEDENNNNNSEQETTTANNSRMAALANVKITEPLGAQTHFMMKAIHTAVLESSTTLLQVQQPPPP